MEFWIHNGLCWYNDPAKLENPDIPVSEFTHVIEKSAYDKAIEALKKIKEGKTCEELNPGCEKYKSYSDGWFGVIEFAERTLKELNEID